MKIVISEFMERASVAALSARFDTIYDPALVERRTDLLALLTDADALVVRNLTRVDRGLLEAAPRLRVVGRLGVGLDNIEVGLCEARGIKVIPAIGANAGAVAEYVIASAMLLLRQAYLRSAETAAGKWPRAALSGGSEIAGKTLGLVGFGGIGRLAARLARALGMRVIAHDPMIAAEAPLWSQTGVATSGFDALLEGADVVSLHVPLTPQTRHLIDRAALARMKPGAVLVNSARGGIVDEAALAAALQSGHLGGAAIDVFEHEPLPANSALAVAPNLILTPHIAGVTLQSNIRVSTLIAEKVGAYLQAGREAEAL